MKEYKLLINGLWEDGQSVKEIKSPYDQKVFAAIHFADKQQVQKAIHSAHLAFDKTKRLSSFERFEILNFISSEIKQRKVELAESIALSAGKTITSARIETDRAANTFQIAAEEARRQDGEIIPLDWSPQTKKRWGLIRRFPIGVVAGITPFNFPLNLVAHKVAPAIASGNPVIIRPASQVSITALLLGEIINQSGLPGGGINIVPCGYEEASPLLDDERVKKITFTGSPEIGWALKKKAFKKKVTLELGGNAAVIIEPDTDFSFALSRTLLGAFSYSGQICISIQRIFLHENIYDRFLADFVTATKKLKMGNPMEEDTEIGPMINLGAAQQMEEWIHEAVQNGGHLVTGGQRNGTLFEPTILENVNPDLRVSCQEAFGPVVIFSPYKDFDEALKGVNHSIYGLQAGVFTKDLQKAFHAYEILDVGGVIVNDIPTFRIDHMPYGGVKESGFGREGLKYAIEEMTELKLMAINLNE
ncbi:MAG: aldehyde dehydrogenase family protein [Candidatus Aminicenantes bacterium]|nr:aldehyde dehydrogenase family protein [Candidatus Aminicenantes bacterium]